MVDDRGTTTQRTASRMKREAKEWLARETSSSVDSRKSIVFGSQLGGGGGRLSVTLELRPGEDGVPWAISTWGPTNSHVGGGQGDDNKKVLSMFDQQVDELMEDFFLLLTWLREDGVDLRKLADEVEVRSVMED